LPVSPVPNTEPASYHDIDNGGSSDSDSDDEFNVDPVLQQDQRLGFHTVSY